MNATSTPRRSRLRTFAHRLVGSVILLSGTVIIATDMAAFVVTQKARHASSTAPTTVASTETST